MYNQLVAKIQFQDDVEQQLFDDAHSLALRVHKGQYRLNGEPYMNHIYRVTDHLTNMQVDTTTYIAALIHDVLNYQPEYKSDIESHFPEDVVNLTLLLHQVKTFQLKQSPINRGDNLRRLLLATAKDIRVILIRLAEKLDNLQSIDVFEHEKQLAVLENAENIYVPLSAMLGVRYLQKNLEDTILEKNYTSQYTVIANYYKNYIDTHLSDFELLEQSIKTCLDEAGIEHVMEKRTKSYYSTYKKYLRERTPNQSLEEYLEHLHDKYAVRILVEDVETCYKALGVIHQHWHPVSEEFDDYIANPKPSGYMAIHTVIRGVANIPVEIQIKTHEQHHINEFGKASHFSYKFGMKHNPEMYQWLQELTEWHSEYSDEAAFKEAVKIDLFKDRVFVFTPDRDVIDLPKGATCIDFAYKIHTHIGDTMSGALVNGKMVPIDHQLESNDTCQIVTSRHGGPRQDWLTKAYRPFTRNRIRKFMRAQNNTR